MFRLVTLVAVVLTALLCLTTGTARARDLPASAVCREVSVPVAIGTGVPVRAQLCVPARIPGTVQVLIPGATYDGTYWNFPYEPGRYSYVDAMLAAGYATLDVDTPGTGQSGHPASALVSMETDASAVHQVIRAARDGAFGIRFPRVITVGHSMGTAVAWREAAAYHDIDGMIATGNVHRPSLPGAAEATATLYPAFLDPAFAREGLDPGYLTTRPGTRAQDFYNQADADPRVIAEDEKTKSTATATYFATYFAEDVDADTARIHVPVLIADGQDDLLMCGPLSGTGCSSSAALLASESPFYGRGSCPRAYVLPNAGPRHQPQPERAGLLRRGGPVVRHLDRSVRPCRASSVLTAEGPGEADLSGHAESTFCAAFSKVSPLVDLQYAGPDFSS